MSQQPTLTETIIARCAAMRLDEKTKMTLIFDPRITDAASLEKVMATVSEIHGLCSLPTVQRPEMVSRFVKARLALPDVRAHLVDMRAEESDKTPINVHAPVVSQRDVWADRGAEA